MLIHFECPACKGEICEVWSLNGSNWGIKLMYWHMVINPGIAINEIFLGQRSPQQMYVCKSCTVPLVDRTYVPCPSCKVFHESRIWSHNNAFGNWLGLICPCCGSQIPCLWNLTSLVILALTAPLWYLPYKRYKSLFLANQYKRICMRQTEHFKKPPEPINYTKMGLWWGLSMEIIFAIVFPILLWTIGIISSASILSYCLYSFLVGLPIWIGGGFAFGYWMKKSLDIKGNPDLHITRADPAQIEEKKESDSE